MAQCSKPRLMQTLFEGYDAVKMSFRAAANRLALFNDDGRVD